MASGTDSMWQKKAAIQQAPLNDRTHKKGKENVVALPFKAGIRKEYTTSGPSKQRKRFPLKCFDRRPPIATVFRVPIPLALKEPKPFNRNAKVVAELPSDVIQINISQERSMAYSYEVTKYSKSVEGQLRYPASFLKMFPRGKTTREILVNWLIDVVSHLKLQPQTLHLTVQLMDRYIMVSDVTLENIQLVGLASLLIATKYEERWPPSVRKLSRLSDNTYTEIQILKMELKQLTALQWEFHIPTAITFLDQGFEVVGRDDSTCELTHYILELALLNHSPIHCSQSTRASAAMYLAHAILGEEKEISNKVCISSLNYHLDNDEVDVVDCIRTFANMLLKASDSQSPTETYWKRACCFKCKEREVAEIVLKVEEILESDMLATKTIELKTKF